MMVYIPLFGQIIILMATIIITGDNFEVGAILNSHNNNNRIVGGDLVRPFGSKPYMAALQIWFSDKLFGQCGATVLDEWHVLTAAHCFNPMISRSGEPMAPVRVDVITRVQRLSPLDPSAVVQIVPIGNLRIHEQWNVTGQFENDIAILKLKNPVNLTEDSYCWTSEEFDGPHHQCIRTAKVDLPNNSTGNIDGVEAVAAGWGKTLFYGKYTSPDLLQVNLRILNNDQCAAMNFSIIRDDLFEDIEDQVPKSFTPLPSQICVAQSESACQGDSGGPLMIGNTQVGIISWGHMLCNSLGIYTRVSSYVDNGWIANHLY